MKVSRSTHHFSDVAADQPAVKVAYPPDDDADGAGFELVYRRYFDDCCRWLRAMGAPASELEDLAQEVFLVVERKLPRAPVRNVAGWIYRIAWNTVSDRRRRAWWRRLFAPRRALGLDELAAEPAAGPAALYERKEEELLLQAMLARLDPRQRRAFVLFEIEGCSGDEIAALEGVPVKTVWTRLHYARKALLAQVQRRSGER